MSGTGLQKHIRYYCAELLRLWGPGPYRVAFFLHFVEPRAGLVTPFGRVRFPSP